MTSGENTKGEKDLYAAVITGDKNEVEKLLKKGVNPNARIYYRQPCKEELGYTYCLIMADDIEIKQLLLDYKAEIDAKDSTGHSDITSLIFCRNASQKNSDRIRFLLDKGANPMSTFEGKSILEKAKERIRAGDHIMKDVVAYYLTPKIDEVSQKLKKQKREITHSADQVPAIAA